MKAKAPEKMYIPQKIYLPYKDGKVIGLVKETGVPYKSGVDGNIEYVRKDAFIKKAEKWLSNEENLPLWSGNNGDFGCDTKALFEQFKKAMML